MTSCRTCELIARRDNGGAPPWDRIRRTAHWDVVHAFDTSIEGWLVLVARRHVSSVGELDDDAVVELGPLLRDVSRVLGSVLGCAKTYVVQFAEHPQHPHVHFHVVPRAEDHPVELLGPQVFKALGVQAPARVPEARMNLIAAKVSEALE
jgi:diadenosine tetraphosphate (Ap4A) HIT family hydrolase